MSAPRYPEAERLDLVERLHGHEVADLYRGLEDPAGPRTRYRAVVCSVPLLDMVRYEEFSLGRSVSRTAGPAVDRLAFLAAHTGLELS